MSAVTPQQMRNLADGPIAMPSENPSEYMPTMRDIRAALRAAADQLEVVEAVKQYVEDGEYQNDDDEGFVYTYSLRRMLGLSTEDK